MASRREATTTTTVITRAIISVNNTSMTEDDQTRVLITRSIDSKSDGIFVDEITSTNDSSFSRNAPSPIIFKPNLSPMPVFHATRHNQLFSKLRLMPGLFFLQRRCLAQTTNPHQAKNLHLSTNLESNQQKKFIKSGILRPEDNNKYERFFFSLNNAASPIIFKPEADACVPRKQRINPHHAENLHLSTNQQKKFIKSDKASSVAMKNLTYSVSLIPLYEKLISKNTKMSDGFVQQQQQRQKHNRQTTTTTTTTYL